MWAVCASMTGREFPTISWIYIFIQHVFSILGIFCPGNFPLTSISQLDIIRFTRNGLPPRPDKLWRFVNWTAAPFVDLQGLHFRFELVCYNRAIVPTFLYQLNRLLRLLSIFFLKKNTQLHHDPCTCIYRCMAILRQLLCVIFRNWCCQVGHVGLPKIEDKGKK